MFFKLVVMGPQSSGKTSFCEVAAVGELPSTHKRTKKREASYLVRRKVKEEDAMIEIMDMRGCPSSVLDDDILEEALSGTERDHSPSSARGVARSWNYVTAGLRAPMTGCIVMYDVRKEGSYNMALEYIGRLSLRGLNSWLVGNMSGEGRRAVSEGRAEREAQSNGARGHWSIGVRWNKGIEEVLIGVCEWLLAADCGEGEKDGGSDSESEHDSIKYVLSLLSDETKGIVPTSRSNWFCGLGLGGGGHFKNRRYFSGHTVISWLVDTLGLYDRTEGLAIAQKILESRAICLIGGSGSAAEEKFHDSATYLYSFSADSQPPPHNARYQHQYTQRKGKEREKGKEKGKGKEKEQGGEEEEGEGEGVKAKKRGGEGEAEGEVMDECNPILIPALLLRKAMLAHTVNDGGAHTGVVDTAAMMHCPYYHDFEVSTSSFMSVNIESFTREERIVFWINAFNLLFLSAIVDCGVPKSALARQSLFDKATFIIGHSHFSLTEIRHGVLRGNTKPPGLFAKAPFTANDPKLAASRIVPPDPRIHFALCCQGSNGPRYRVIDPDSLDEGLNEAAKVCQKSKVNRNRIVQFSELKYRTDFDEHIKMLLEKGELEMRFPNSSDVRLVEYVSQWFNDNDRNLVTNVLNDSGIPENQKLRLRFNSRSFVGAPRVAASSRATATAKSSESVEFSFSLRSAIAVDADAQAVGNEKKENPASSISVQTRTYTIVPPPPPSASTSTGQKVSKKADKGESGEGEGEGDAAGVGVNVNVLVAQELERLRAQGEGEGGDGPISIDLEVASDIEGEEKEKEDHNSLLVDRYLRSMHSNLSAQIVPFSRLPLHHH